MKKAYVAPIFEIIVINTKDILFDSQEPDYGWTEDY